MNGWRQKRFHFTAPLLLMMTIGGLFLAAQTALADSVGPGDFCMGTLFFDATGQKLNCTSNDVKIAEALNDAAHPISPSSCEDGSTFDLTATFKVVLSGGGSNQTRYDIGLYFDALGDPEGNGARGGTCDLAVIQNGDNDYFNFDPSPDICGDISTAHNPLFPRVTLKDVLCTDTDHDGFVNLPNGTSWRQPGANQECKQATDAFPGTSSKCNCNDTFNVPVTVTPASATLNKKPTQAVVTYEVKIENTTPRPLKIGRASCR